MLFAQPNLNDPTTSSALITTLVGLLAIGGIMLVALNVTEKVKTIFFNKEKPSPDEQYVTMRQYEQQSLKLEQMATQNTQILLKLERLTTIIATMRRQRSQEDDQD
jgi:hypothetical protein